MRPFRYVRRMAGSSMAALRRLSAAGLRPDGAGNWLRFGLAGPLQERTLPGGLGMRGRSVIGLLDLQRSLDLASRDPRIAGVVLELRGLQLGLSQALSLRRSLRSFAEAGRSVAVFAESLGEAGYLMASAAHRIYMPPGAILQLTGLRTERFYLKEALEKLGIAPELVHIGEFKSAGDMLTRSAMGEQEREQIESYLGDLFEALCAGIAEGRGLTRDSVPGLIDEGPFPVADAAAAGLVDAVCYADELPRVLEAQLRETQRPGSPSLRPGTRRTHLVDGTAYFHALVESPRKVPITHELPTLVHLLACGGVSRGAGLRGIAHRSMEETLESLRTAAHVRGVLLRVDSPGGDALASDLIHRGIERLARFKPVVVSMGEVAASGGYYIAAPADCIFAEVGTLTGSIGVVGGKPNVKRLYDRLGIRKEAIQHGRRAGLYSETEGFGPDERKAIRGEMEKIYGLFLDRVEAGRALPRKDLEAIARGRIWSGKQALRVGLVDRIGGPLEALSELRALSGLSGAESFKLPTLPRLPLLPLALGGFGASGAERLLRP